MSEPILVCAVHDLQDCTPRAVQVSGVDLAMVRIHDQVFAIQDLCSHAEIPLSEGAVEPDGTISCWLHGSRFDLRTGEPEELPAWEPVPVYQTELIEHDGTRMVAVARSADPGKLQERAV